MTLEKDALNVKFCLRVNFSATFLVLFEVVFPQQICFKHFFSFVGWICDTFRINGLSLYVRDKNYSILITFSLSLSILAVVEQILHTEILQENATVLCIPYFTKRTSWIFMTRIHRNNNTIIKLFH